MDRLSGKRALITGGTTGIGLETAEQFLAEGAQLIITGNNPENLAKRTGRARAAGDRHPRRRRRSRRTAAPGHHGRRNLGRLDIAFRNAGIADWRPFANWDEAAFTRQLTVNFTTPFFLLQALLPHLANPSSVVLNASNSAHKGFATASAHAATEAALADRTGQDSLILS